MQAMGFTIGDKVKIGGAYAGKWTGVIFTVDKFLTKNVELVTSSGQRLRAKPHQLVAVDAPHAPATVETKAWEPPLVVGTVVVFKAALYVIMACNPSGRYRVVKLGGDANKYYTNVARAHMNVVELAEIPTLLTLHSA